MRLVEHGIPVKVIREKLSDKLTKLMRAKFEIPNEEIDKIDKIREEILEALDRLMEEYSTA